MFDIRIVSILTANDDGSQAATTSVQAVSDAVDVANTVYFTTQCVYNWNKAEGRWVYGPQTISWSNQDDEFVSMVWGNAGPRAPATTSICPILTCTGRQRPAMRLR